MIPPSLIYLWISYSKGQKSSYYLAHREKVVLFKLIQILAKQQTQAIAPYKVLLVQHEGMHFKYPSGLLADNRW